MNKSLVIIFSFFALGSSAQTVNISRNIRKAMNGIDTHIIRSNIAWLADDKLKGRLPGTEGNQMADD